MHSCTQRIAMVSIMVAFFYAIMVQIYLTVIQFYTKVKNRVLAWLFQGWTYIVMMLSGPRYVELSFLCRHSL